MRHGKTVNLAHLSQTLAELAPEKRPLEAVEEVRRHITFGGKEVTASQMLERFGFRGERQWTPIGDLSGGERRRLQLLRLLMNEPNVLLMDEPTNDLDIETLTELEDLLDGWPGTLVVVSHDRWFLERVSDRVMALMGDGGLLFLPGGVDEYLQRRARQTDAGAGVPGTAPSPAPKARPLPLRTRPPGCRRPSAAPCRRRPSASSAVSTASALASPNSTSRWPRRPTTTRAWPSSTPNSRPSGPRRRSLRSSGSPKRRR